MDNKRPLLDAVEGGVTVRDYNACISADEGHIGFIVPMYVREGAVIPMLEAEQYVGEFHSQGRPHPLTFAIYPGRSGTYTCYLDDGVSRSSAPVIAADRSGAKQEYRAVEIRHEYAGKQERRISVKRIWDKYTPKYETYYYLAVLHDSKELAADACPVGAVTLDKKRVPFIEGGLDALKQSAPDTWAFDAQAGITYIKVEDNNPARLAVLV
jgi:alpha-glucosidase